MQTFKQERIVEPVWNQLIVIKSHTGYDGIKSLILLNNQLVDLVCVCVS